MLHIRFDNVITDDRVAHHNPYVEQYLEDTDLIEEALEVIDLIDKPIQYYGNLRWELRKIGVGGLESISGGSKAIIASMMYPELVYPLYKLGNNCAEALYRVCLKRDLSWSLGMSGFKFYSNQQIVIDKTNKIIEGSSVYEYLRDKGLMDEITKDVCFRLS